MQRLIDLLTMSASIASRPAVLALLAAVCLAAVVDPAQACGRTTDCLIGERTYRIVLPAERDDTTPLGAIVFAHGYRGSADGVMRSDGLVGLAEALGVAFVAANADGRDWRIPGVPSFPEADGVEALAYFDALRQALIDRHGVDPERIVASGFSAGGMMAWQLACHRGQDYAGFIPLSGTFWAPLPETCPTTAVDLIHYHGTEDAVVPLDGRPINQSRQGNVRDAIALFTEAGGYRAIDDEAEAGLDCDLALNDAGQRLELCLYAGGHGFSHEHLVRAMRLFGMAPDG
jgi:polyhydroxybutyrate depolymerase